MAGWCEDRRYCQKEMPEFAQSGDAGSNPAPANL